MKTEYDVITIGGGLGGAALAKVLAENGKRVLVVERETEFKDRIRGEAISSWGAAELHTLGLYEALLKLVHTNNLIFTRLAWVLRVISPAPLLSGWAF